MNGREHLKKTDTVPAQSALPAYHRIGTSIITLYSYIPISSEMEFIASIDIRINSLNSIPA